MRDSMPFYPLLAEKIENGNEIIYGLLINLFNEFCACGGIKAVLDIISLQKENTKIPMDFLAFLLAPFKNLRAVAKPEALKDLVESGKITFCKRIEKLDEKEIKDMNKDLFSESMETLKGFLKLYLTKEEAAKFIQEQNVQISLKFLKSPYLEKRLYGIGEIKRMIQQNVADQQMRRYAMQTKNLQNNESLNANALAHWIIDQKILELIFNENAHAELIKRSSFLLTYLSSESLLTKEMLDFIWNCQQGKHEDIVRAIYDTFKEIVENLPIDVCLLH